MASATVSSPLMANSPSYSNGNHTAAVPNTHYAAVRVSAPETQEIADKLQQIHFQLKLNIEVVDDTALIDAPLISKGKGISHRKKNPKRKGPKQLRFASATADDRISDKMAVVTYSRAEMLALNSEGLESEKKWMEVYGGLDASVAAEYDGLASSAGGLKSHFHHRPFLEKSYNFEAQLQWEKKAL